MNIIEELYLGNIELNPLPIKKGSACEKALKDFGQREEMLMKLLEGREKNLLIDLINAHDEMFAEEPMESFVRGFRLGARFMLDIFINDEEDYLAGEN